MTPDEAMARSQPILAHLWMVRTFLKHAPEIEEDAELLEVPRTLFDSIRAVEPARMASAMRLAVEAGRLAYTAGRIPRRHYALASTVDEGRAQW